ncbi:autotransporter outer membrane beta-barrel domain-containing protein [Phaeovibrio sulfidiphilus]|uniref:Autotransporter outer membrane beta-barrel domain-containing protein n=1 Tax=Phaeovibrio sulfidiphilus TaxID=1220600 RepID=A0A8J6YWI1_9PROT|nr:autotransporter outer membrane beta-barrel domain-containing protein [Phaeovibrio sulfidiphilus]MBE1237739.1 autotransporter outer membrane beta-barrel domain-containing protein [Phaeovibrio sulfidiphilus]
MSLAAPGKTAVLASALALALAASPLPGSGTAHAVDNLYILGGGGGGGAEAGKASGGGGGGTVYQGPDKTKGGAGADGDGGGAGGVGVDPTTGGTPKGTDANGTTGGPGSKGTVTGADVTATGGDVGKTNASAASPGGKGGDASVVWTGNQSIGTLYLMGGNAGGKSTDASGGKGGDASLKLSGGTLTVSGGSVESGKKADEASGGAVNLSLSGLAFDNTGGTLTFKKNDAALNVTIDTVYATQNSASLAFVDTVASDVTIGKFVIGGEKTLKVTGAQGTNYTLKEDGGVTVTGKGGTHNFDGGLTLGAKNTLAFEKVDVGAVDGTAAKALLKKSTDAAPTSTLKLADTKLSYDADSQAAIDTKLTDLGAGLVLADALDKDSKLAADTGAFARDTDKRKFVTVLSGAADAAKDLVVYKASETRDTLPVASGVQTYTARYGDISHTISGDVTLSGDLKYDGANKATVTGKSLTFAGADKTFTLGAKSGSSATFGTVNVNENGKISLGAGNTVNADAIVFAKGKTLTVSDADAGAITVKGLTVKGEGATYSGNVALALKDATLTIDLSAKIDDVSKALLNATSDGLSGNIANITLLNSARTYLLEAADKAAGNTYTLVSGLASGTTAPTQMFAVGQKLYDIKKDAADTSLVVAKDTASEGKRDVYASRASVSSSTVWEAGTTGKNTSSGGGDYTDLQRVVFTEGLKTTGDATATFRSTASKTLLVQTSDTASVSGNIVLDRGEDNNAVLTVRFGVLDATKQNTTLTLKGTRAPETTILRLAVGGGNTLTINGEKGKSDFQNPMPISIGSGGGTLNIFRDTEAKEVSFDLAETDVAGVTKSTNKIKTVDQTKVKFSAGAPVAIAAGINKVGNSLTLLENVSGNDYTAALGDKTSAVVGDGKDMGVWTISHTLQGSDAAGKGVLAAYATSVSSDSVTYDKSRTFTPTYGSFTQTVGSESKPGRFTIAGGAQLVYEENDKGKATLDLTRVSDLVVRGFGNVLKVGASSKVDLKGKTLSFIADSPVDVSKPMLTLSTPTDVSIDDTRIEMSSATKEYYGGRVNLLRVTDGGKLIGKPKDGKIRIGEGIIDRTDVPAEILNDHDLYANISGGNVDTRGGHGYVLQAFATQTVLNQGGDAVADISGSIVPLPGTEVWWNGEYEAVGFATVGGYWNEQSPASTVKTRGFSFAGGPGVRINHDAGPLNIVAFFESGWGDYDTEHSFWGGRGTGEGKAVYAGGGVLLRQDFLMGLYLEGSLRGGWASNDFRNRNVSGGADLKTDAGYFGGHLGAGYEFPVFDDQGSIDIYGKFLWTYVGETDGRVNDFQKVDIDSSTSLRTRLGVRYAHELDYNFRGYVGVAWEQEFDGEVAGHVRNVNGTVAERLPSADVRGATGVLEAGLNYYTDSGVTLNGKIFGSAGERDSFGGKISASFAF